jgi:hypothetical protein
MTERSAEYAAFPDRGWSASLDTYLTEYLVSVVQKTQLELPIRGIGADLMQSAIRESGSIGWQAIFLLGSPEYYARLG